MLRFVLRYFHQGFDGCASCGRINYVRYLFRTIELLEGMLSI